MNSDATLKLPYHRAWVLAAGDRTFRLDYDGLNENSVVVDVGGYHGDWADAIHKRYGCLVHICEPIPELAERIRRRFEGNSKIFVHPVGLGASTNKARISLAEDGSSVFGNKANSVEIDIQDISEFIRENKISHRSDKD
ncbi:MAG: hypothetical protein P4M08_06140 [Oligoflexia bacterium]|nr:hypothetical protein [Oligoflexia bacterium]